MLAEAHSHELGDLSVPLLKFEHNHNQSIIVSCVIQQIN
eukprot:COSAG01_NODE_7201_length_3306_cov_59.287496_4_plen_39_part_00